MKLTEKAVRAAKPGDKLTHDGGYGSGRLMLVVSAAGRKSWVYRDRRGGKDRSKTLGTHPDMGLAEAIIAASRCRAPEPKPEPAAASGTLAELLAAYVTSLGERRHAREARGVFRLALPEGDPLRSRASNSITTAEIATVLRRRAATGATTSVNRLRSALHAAFAYAAKHDYDPRRPDGAATFEIQANPVTGTPRVDKWERVRSRVLTDAEIKTFIAGCRARNDALGDLWHLVLLTGARLTQLVDAQFDEDRITITDTKGRGGQVKKACVLPITPAMRPLIFRAALAHSCHIDSIRKAGAALMPEGATPSDVRRTVETQLQQLGVSRELRGALLSHGNSGVQARHYERAELLDQKLDVLRRYHAALERIASCATVASAQLSQHAHF